MNIFDLSWCIVYLAEERARSRRDPSNQATSFLSTCGLMFIMWLYFFFNVIGFYSLLSLELSLLFFTIVYILIYGFFLFRYRKKDIRNKILEEYREYKKEHPRKSTFRFIMFITIPILPFCTTLIIASF
jgi:Ca2+/Na+ antiporter